MKSKTFSRTFLLLATAVVISGSVSAQSKSQSWIRGVWDGTGYQIDDKSTWPMTLIARRRTFSINYPSLSCGGHWKLISINASRARFREVLDRGQDKCADKGNVLIQRLNRNQIVFLYSYQKTREISASAVLNRRLDVSINGFRSRCSKSPADPCWISPTVQNRMDENGLILNYIKMAKGNSFDSRRW